MTVQGMRARWVIGIVQRTPTAVRQYLVTNCAARLTARSHTFFRTYSHAQSQNSSTIGNRTHGTNATMTNVISRTLGDFSALKITYFFYFAAQLTQLFLPLILSQVMRFSLPAIGVLMAARRLILSIAAPLFTALCDRTFRHRYLLVAAHIAYYTCSVLLASLRSLPAVAFIVVIREMFVSGCEPTINNAALAAVHDTRGKPTAFGSLRLYGSVGWGAASALAPFLTDRYFGGNLATLLYFQALLGLPVVLLIYFCVDLSPALFRRQAERKAVAVEQYTQPGWAHLRALSHHALHAMAVAVLQGAALGAIQTTSFIYFTSIGMTSSVLGAAVTLSCVAEAALFSVDAALSSRLGGASRAFSVGAAANAACLLMYAAVQYAPSPALAFMLSEVACGAAHAVFLSASLTLAEDLAPAGAATSAQGVLTALLYGIGPAIGALLAGIAYENVGAPLFYVALALAQFVLLLPPLAPRLCDSDEYSTILPTTTAAAAADNELAPLLPATTDALTPR
eukprot:IDg5656t1